MTVKQLIAKLKKLEQNRIVVLSSDAEGNSFSLLREISTCAAREEGYEVEVGLEALTGEARKMGYTEEDVMLDGKPAVVLSP